MDKTRKKQKRAMPVVDTVKETPKPKLSEDFSGMAFADILKLKDELGTKMYNEAVFGTTTRRQRQASDTSKSQQFKRDNKNRPAEMSSKKPPSIKKEQSSTPVCRDPRFSEKSGYFNERAFRKDYGFVSELRDQELETLKEQLASTRDGAERKNLRFLVNRIENQKREAAKNEQADNLRQQEKERIKQTRLAGQMPYFVKKSEQKAQQLVTQFKELKNSGRLKKHIEKRRKKSAAKDRKKYSFD